MPYNVNVSLCIVFYDFLSNIVVEDVIEGTLEIEEVSIIFLLIR